MVPIVFFVLLVRYQTQQRRMPPWYINERTQQERISNSGIPRTMLLQRPVPTPMTVLMHRCTNVPGPIIRIHARNPLQTKTRKTREQHNLSVWKGSRCPSLDTKHSLLLLRPTFLISSGGIFIFLIRSARSSSNLMETNLFLTGG